MKDNDISKLLIESLLGRVAEPSGLVQESLRLIDAAKDQLWIEAGEAVAGHLFSRCGEGEELTKALDELSRRDTALARFVRARVLAYRGDVEAALEGFGLSLQAAALGDPFVLLHRVRLLSRTGRFAEAVEEFRAALRLYPPYSFFIRSEKILERLITSGACQPRRIAKTALLSSSTTALLAPVLRAAGFREGIQFDIYEGVYGNYQQEILDPNSGLYRFQPDVVVIILNHRDLGLPPSGGKALADEMISRLRGLWQTLNERRPCRVVQVGFDVPPSDAWGSLEDTLPEGRRRLLHHVNSALADNLPAGVSFLDAGAAAAEVGPDFWSDAEWHASKQYPSSTALPRFADYVCSHCAAALGLGAKALVLDLDNTLWGGVIGEDLLGGIRVGPPGAEGEGYLALQRYVKELQQRGILLAVCSKNNREDAELPFREHEAMLLKLDDFAAFEANWLDKADNLQAIAENLSLGLDSFVFLDDNPMERAFVRSRLPQVVVPECGSKPWEMLAALRRGLYFQSIHLTQEDLERHRGYQGNIARKALEQSAASLDDFLAGLEMSAEHGPVDAKTLPRVTQLINKTNQFNLTTRRYAEEQVRALAESPDWWCRWFKLADRFGDHGLIGVLLARKDKSAWNIDTWLMSCRVLGRNMEKFMAQTLLTAAREQGAASVVGEYVPTAKNGLVKDLYPRLGFEVSADRSGKFVFDLVGKPIPECAFIRDVRGD
jgi:FkbH-like protein